MIKLILKQGQPWMKPITINNEIMKTVYWDKAEDVDVLEYQPQLVKLSETAKQARHDHDKKARKYKAYTIWAFNFETNKNKVHCKLQQHVIIFPHRGPVFWNPV